MRLVSARGVGRQGSGGSLQQAKMERMKRAWHITKTNAAALDLSLDFNLSDAGVALLDERERPAYKLVRSLDGGATLPVVAVKREGRAPARPQRVRMAWA